MSSPSTRQPRNGAVYMASPTSVRTTPNPNRANQPQQTQQRDCKQKALDWICSTIGMRIVFTLLCLLVIAFIAFTIRSIDFHQSDSIACDQDKRLIDGKCKVCPNNTTWNGTTCTNQKKNPQQQQKGRLKQSEQIKKQPEEQKPTNNKAAKVVSTAPPPNLTKQIESKECQPGTYAYKNLCLKCPSNAQWNGTHCIKRHNSTSCGFGYVLYRNKCILRQNAPSLGPKSHSLSDF